MNKIICDICGTSYPETADKCPICGCSKDFGMENFDDILNEELGYTEAEDRKRNRGIFDYDEVNQEDEPEEPEEDDFDDEEEYEEEPQSNTALVVILVVLIVLLLLAAGFFFVRFFLPNIIGGEEETLPVVTTEAVVETTEETQDPSIIPCTDLSIPGGKVELAKDGKWLLNVQVYPEDTTDTLSYTSADESIATVSEDGTVTAVGEGKTTIIVACGSRQINCNVTVDYSLETENTTDGTIPGMTVEATEAPAETTAEGETQPEETTDATEATTEATVDPSTELKLKKTDITIFSNRVSVTLELENEIPMDQIKWFTMDSTVAIVHDGVVTATGSGITSIYGEYNGQQVECIVRCNF